MARSGPKASLAAATRAVCGVPAHAGTGLRRAGAATEPARRALAPVVWLLRRVWSPVTPLGRSLIAAALICGVLAAYLGWSELNVLAAAALALLALSALMMLGRTSLEVRLVVEPVRVPVGGAVAGEIVLRNTARSPLLPVMLELPVGAGGVRFGLPILGRGTEHSEVFIVPTERRAVVQVGPVTTTRGDAVGLFRRDVVWTESVEVFVHPRVVPLESLGAGLLRDLEGTTSDNISMSDLAFHALREYSPGDDLRHVHWRSSAKAGELLVRQYLDTRRSHVLVVVDSAATAYDDAEEFETAVSAAASIMLRALLDSFDVSFVCGPRSLLKGSRRAALDACSRVEPGSENLVDSSGVGARLATDASLAVFVTGRHADYRTLQRSAALFPIETGRLAIRVHSGAAPSLKPASHLSVLTVSRLEDLPIVMRADGR